MLPEPLRGYSSYREWLEAEEEFKGRVVFARLRPKAPPRPAPYEGAFAGVLRALGLTPYLHQQRALKRVEAGANVVLAYPTAAGKSLVYQAPVLQAALEGATSLLLFPTKALAHDQLRRLRAMAQVLGVEGVFPYDGDTPSATRRQARERAWPPPPP